MSEPRGFVFDSKLPFLLATLLLLELPVYPPSFVLAVLPVAFDCAASLVLRERRFADCCLFICTCWLLFWPEWCWIGGGLKFLFVELEELLFFLAYGLLCGLCNMMFGGKPFMIHSCCRPSSGVKRFFGSHSRHRPMKLTNDVSGISRSLFMMYLNLSSFWSLVRTSSGAGTALSLN